jgi:hypothetical protein
MHAPEDEGGGVEVEYGCVGGEVVQEVGREEQVLLHHQHAGGLLGFMHKGGVDEGGGGGGGGGAAVDVDVDDDDNDDDDDDA